MTDLLFEIPENPIPQHATAGMLAMKDGKRIRYAHFRATGRPLKGTVLILPGRNECIEKYFETISDLSRGGFGCATFDWRGQGGSDRMIKDPGRGYIRSFDDYVDDLETFFEEIVLPDCRAPYHMLAHSTGGLIALLAAPRFVNRVRRMVVTTPLLTLPGLPLSMERLGRLARLLRMVGLGRMYLGSGPRPREAAPFATNKVTTDRARYSRNQAIYRHFPQLALGGATVSWVHAACVAAATVSDPEFLAAMRIPILLVAAGADEVVSNRAIEDVALGLRGSTMLTIDGARHELLQEADIYREQFLAAFHAFVPGSDAVAE